MNGENVITGPPSIVNTLESEGVLGAAGVAPVTVIKYPPGGVPDLTSNVPAIVPSAASLQTADITGVPESVHEAAVLPLKPEPDTETWTAAEPEEGERLILGMTVNRLNHAWYPLVVPTT
jgi:hypothetical protein